MCAPLPFLHIQRSNMTCVTLLSRTFIIFDGYNHTLHSWKIYILKIHHCKRDLDYIILKGIIAKPHSQIPNIF
jgi:hypothetical protein